MLKASQTRITSNLC